MIIIVHTNLRPPVFAFCVSFLKVEVCSSEVGHPNTVGKNVGVHNQKSHSYSHLTWSLVPEQGIHNCHRPFSGLKST